MASGDIVQTERIGTLIHFIRGQKVMLDTDLAKVYGVPTKVLNQAINRNRLRFPEDFMFQVTPDELKALRSQIVTSKKGRGGARYLPYAFTEHGAIMAATVLNSRQAVETSVLVVRAFVKLREILASNKELAVKLDELESRLDGHDEALQQIVAAIRELAAPLKERKSKRLGFSKPVIKQGAQA